MYPFKEGDKVLFNPDNPTTYEQDILQLQEEQGYVIVDEIDRDGDVWLLAESCSSWCVASSNIPKITLYSEDIPQRNEGVEYRCFLPGKEDYLPVVLDVQQGRYHVLDADGLAVPWSPPEGRPIVAGVEDPKKWVTQEGFIEVSIDEFLRHFGL